MRLDHLLSKELQSEEAISKEIVLFELLVEDTGLHWQAHCSVLKDDGGPSGPPFLFLSYLPSSVIDMTLTPENVAGLVVGEGCFYAESTADPKYRSGWRIRPAFCIEMRDEERPVLEEVQRMLKCGAIYRLDFGRYRGYQARGWKPHVKYRVTRIGDLYDRVVPFFEAWSLFGRKLQAFELFAELVKGIHDKEHLTDAGLQRLKRCAANLAKHNERGGTSIPPEVQDALARVRLTSGRS